MTAEAGVAPLWALIFVATLITAALVGLVWSWWRAAVDLRNMRRHDRATAAMRRTVRQ